MSSYIRTFKESRHTATTLDASLSASAHSQRERRRDTDEEDEILAEAGEQDQLSGDDEIEDAA